jgi:hypothetical protein
MPQRELALLADLPQPSTVSTDVVRSCKTFREAVRMSWALRRIKSDTYANFAANHGFIPQHISDYLNSDDRRGRKNLPADMVPMWNCGTGNTLVTQWIVAGNSLTLLEEMQATRRAA